MARDYFKEQVAADEAQELVKRLGFTLAKGYAERKLRDAQGEDETTAWRLISRRIRKPEDTEAPYGRMADGSPWAAPEAEGGE